MLLLCRAHTIPLLVCLVSSGGQKLQNEDGSYPDDIPKVTAEDAKRGVEEHYCGGKNCYDVIGMPRPDEPDPDEPAKTKKKKKSGGRTMGTGLVSTWELELGRKYQKLLKQWDPANPKNKGSEAEAQRNLEELDHAYSVLRDARARSLYNYHLDNPDHHWYNTVYHWYVNHFRHVPGWVFLLVFLLISPFLPSLGSSSASRRQKEQQETRKRSKKNN